MTSRLSLSALASWLRSRWGAWRARWARWDGRRYVTTTASGSDNRPPGLVRALPLAAVLSGPIPHTLLGHLLRRVRADGRLDDERASLVRLVLNRTFKEEPMTPLSTNPRTSLADIEAGESTEFGSRWTIPYGLCRAHGYYTPSFGARTGVDSTDLDFWVAVNQMFETDRSSARGEMRVQGLHVFSHTSPLGDAHAHHLFDRITVSRVSEGPARHWTDYQVDVADDDLPAGVTLAELTI
jgi:hypothetical protein